MAQDFGQLAPPAHRVWDRGGARPVLALHCSLAHSGAWSGVAAHLTGVTITAPDLPGHGRAPDWDGVTDLHALTTDQCIALAKAVGGGAPVDLLGHSFGATVALRMALERPDLVRSLVLIEPPLFAAARAAGAAAFGPFRDHHLLVSQALAEGRRVEAASMFHATWGNGGRFADLPDRQQRYMVDRIHLIAAQNAFLLNDAANLLRVTGLEGVDVPVLMVEGAASPAIVRAVQDEIARRLPDVSRLVVPDAGHMVPISHPQAVALAITDHLARSQRVSADYNFV